MYLRGKIEGYSNRGIELSDYNLTLMLPQQTSNSEYILIGAIGAAFLTGIISLVRDELRYRKEENRRRIQAYSRLMGIKGVISQLYASYFSSFIDAGYYNGRSRIVAIQNIDYDNIRRIREENGILNAVDKLLEENKQARRKALEYEGATEEKRKYEELRIQVSKADERFKTIIGLIRTSFPRTKKLESLIDEIILSDKALEAFSIDVASSFCFFENMVQNWLWKIPSNEMRNIFYSERDRDINIIRDMKFIDADYKINDFESKIENLLNYLDQEIKK